MKMRRQIQSTGASVPADACADLENSSSPFMVTSEAAAYLRKSVSWLLRQSGIPYLPGRPNLYKKTDIDSWFEKKKSRPKTV